ncbi:MAG: hypothetical protein K2W92_00370 [Alphaproteobacteria bacterium]|nr:hypothetical protein [Alphaproteobacteria bacterium]
MNERALRLYGIGKYATKRHFSITVILFFCLGALFAFWGVSDMIHSNEYFSSYSIFTVFCGILFIFLSLLAWRRNKKTGFIL